MSLSPSPTLIQSIVRCPRCRGELRHANEHLHCSACSHHFVIQHGVPMLFAEPQPEGHSYSVDHRFKQFFKRWPFLYNILFWVVGPALLTGLTSKKFIRRLPGSALILHAGSGTRRLASHCINLDVFATDGVDIAADIRHLPFADHTFDAVTNEQVLEHVGSPHLAAAEMIRVTKSDGLLHIAVPFMFPWHPSPSDYTRWTHEGISDLFPGCTVIEKGISAGPCSAATGFLAAFLATILCFGSRTLQAILQYVFLVLLIPLKLFDVIFARMPGAELCCSELYIVLKKD